MPGSHSNSSSRIGEDGKADGMVMVDINRLCVRERRENSILRKLLQTQGLVSSDAIAGGMSDSGNDISDSGNQHSRPGSSSSSDAQELHRRIAAAQEIITVLGAAIQAGGVMREEDAVR